MTPQVNADSNNGGINQRRKQIKQIDPNKLGMGKSMFSMAGLRAGDNLLQKASIDAKSKQPVEEMK